MFSGVTTPVCDLHPGAILGPHDAEAQVKMWLTFYRHWALQQQVLPPVVAPHKQPVSPPVVAPHETISYEDSLFVVVGNTATWNISHLCSILLSVRVLLAHAHQQVRTAMTRESAAKGDTKNLTLWQCQNTTATEEIPTMHRTGTAADETTSVRWATSG